MWGQAALMVKALEYEGIIPTRVGTSLSHWQHFPQAWDHPHACGDKQNLKRARENRKGSSPRVWGQADETPEMFKDIRIIPTRVGTSLGQLSHIALYEDHPHACGDKQRWKPLMLFLVGSSPRVWGQV